MIDALAITTDEARQGIDARELHRALGVGRDFTTWIRDQASRLQLAEGTDYFRAQSLRSPDSGSAKARPQLADEYILSVSSAKLIALGQNSETARLARAALVEIEAKWNSPEAVVARALQITHAALTRTRLEVQHALAKVAELEPKAAALDRLSAASGDVNLQDAGRVLGRQPNRFVAQLLEDGLLFRGAHGKPEPYAQWRDAGYFRVRISEVRGDAYLQTLVTPKGLAWLAGRYPQAPAVAVETSH